MEKSIKLHLTWKVFISAESGGVGSSKTKRVVIAAGITVGIAIVLFGVILYFLSKRRKYQGSIRTKSENKGIGDHNMS